MKWHPMHRTAVGLLYERIDVCQVVARVYPDFGISRTAPGQGLASWAWSVDNKRNK